MTNPIIPYTFIPGTKAKAEEVNQNFTSIAEKIDNMEVNTSDKFNQIKDEFKAEFDDLNKNYASIDLSNTNIVSNCIIEAPNGVAEYENSTITVKSGLKLLIPDGRNENSKLKSIVHTTPADLNINTSDFADSKRTLFITNSNTCITTLSEYYFVQNNEPVNPNSTNFVWFNPATNILKQYNIVTEKWDIIYATKIGEFTTSSELITNLSTQEPYSVLTQNDKPEITKLYFPSDRYIDLELGASGTKYTAPANGYIAIKKISGGADKYINIYVHNSDGNIDMYGLSNWGLTSGNTILLYAPIQKRTTFVINYSATGNTSFFRFIYAQGESEE